MSQNSLIKGGEQMESKAAGAAAVSRYMRMVTIIKDGEITKLWPNEFHDDEYSVHGKVLGSTITGWVKSNELVRSICHGWLS